MLPVSLSFAAALALFNLFLAYRVIRVRMAAKVLTGDGGHALLVARMRAQANFVEYSPFVLALVVLIELAHGPRPWLRAVAILYLLGRIAHAFGMDAAKPGALRSVGIMTTYAILIALAVWALASAYHFPAAAGATARTETMF